MYIIHKNRKKVQSFKIYYNSRHKPMYIYKFTLVCVNSMIYVLGPKITKKLTTRYCIHAYNTQFYPNCNRHPNTSNYTSNIHLIRPEYFTSDFTAYNCFKKICNTSSESYF